jgi:predicted ester cyclase
MSEENKSIAQRFLHELWNSENPNAIDDLMDPNCDGDICHLRPGGAPPTAAEAFSAVNSALYADSVLKRIGEARKTHPELAQSIVKTLLIRHEGNFRGIVKSSAKNYREAVPDVRCTIVEMIAQEDMVWARWTLRGTFNGRASAAGAFLDGKAAIATGVSIFRFFEGKIQDYRSYAMSDRWLESVAGIIPRP